MCSQSDNDAARLALPKEYEFLGTQAGSFLIDSCRIAAQLCGAKAAAIHLFDSARRTCVAQTDRFQEAVLHSEVLVGQVPGSKKIPFQKQIQDRFYIGVPLLKGGLTRGVLSVIGPHRIIPETGEMLVLHARGLMEQISIRYQLNRKESTSEEGLSGNVVEGVFQTSPEGRYLAANTMLARIYGYESREELVEELHDISGQLYAEPDRRDEFVRLMKENDVITNFVSQIRRRDGEVIWISENVHGECSPQREAGLCLA